MPYSLQARTNPSLDNDAPASPLALLKRARDPTDAIRWFEPQNWYADMSQIILVMAALWHADLSKTFQKPFANLAGAQHMNPALPNARRHWRWHGHVVLRADTGAVTGSLLYALCNHGRDSAPSNARSHRMGRYPVKKVQLLAILRLET